MKPDGSVRTGYTWVRVRYAETDAMGWVYYANYLCYFEVGRTELIREVWRAYRKIEEEGYRLPVVKSGCKHYAGAKYDDQLEIRTRMSLPSGARVRFDYDIRCLSDGQRIVSGFTEHCFLMATGRIARIPTGLQSLLHE